MDNYIVNAVIITGDRAKLNQNANSFHVDHGLLADMEDPYYVCQFITQFPENHGLEIVDINAIDPDFFMSSVNALVSVENFNKWTPEMIDFWNNTSLEKAEPFLMSKEDLLSKSI